MSYTTTSEAICYNQCILSNPQNGPLLSFEYSSVSGTNCWCRASHSASPLVASAAATTLLIGICAIYTPYITTTVAASCIDIQIGGCIDMYAFSCSGENQGISISW